MLLSVIAELRLLLWQASVESDAKPFTLAHW